MLPSTKVSPRLTGFSLQKNLENLNNEEKANDGDGKTIS